MTARWEIPYTFFMSPPADGTLSTAGPNPGPPAGNGKWPYGQPRVRDWVVPFEVATPLTGSLWRLDSVWVTNVSDDDAWWSASIAPAGTARGSLKLAAYTFHLGWGQLLEAGETEALETGGLAVAGPPTTGAPGQALYAAAWPGGNLNAPGGPGDLYNDGIPAAITMGMSGVILL